jgi:hypothetical protein
VVTGHEVTDSTGHGLLLVQKCGMTDRPGINRNIALLPVGKSWIVEKNDGSSSNDIFTILKLYGLMVMSCGSLNNP